MVKINENTLSMEGCREFKKICLVAVSLYANLNVEYNKDYYNNGVAYISTNTFHNSLSFYASNIVTGKYSMTEFNHHFDRNGPIP